MPPRNRNRRRPGRRPNVFVQTEEPTARRQQPEQPEEDIAAPSAATATVPAPRNLSASTNRPQTANPRRTQRTRSEVYARTFPLEIRKMGIIATGIVVALAVFTIAL
ncbi:MAG: hypothetical protein OXC83_10250 [Chloroflexi bacterium]|nr:hypothetical protein [Chloroflexota bacterium]